MVATFINTLVPLLTNINLFYGINLIFFFKTKKKIYFLPKRLFGELFFHLPRKSQIFIGFCQSLKIRLG
ncbi:hypothetical protein EGX28_15100 [Enterococcus avium]|nr:hypothetical protein EGX28_15100 [Enterococcus avium]